MGSLSIWHWLVVLLFFGLVPLVPAWRILARAGCAGAWALPIFVPVVNVVALWIFAFSRWPNAMPRE